MNQLGQCGETLLSLVEYGLEVPEGALTNLTKDGWHHLRVLRCVLTDLFPHSSFESCTD